MFARTFLFLCSTNFQYLSLRIRPIPVLKVLVGSNFFCTYNKTNKTKGKRNQRRATKFRTRSETIEREVKQHDKLSLSISTAM